MKPISALIIGAVCLLLAIFSSEAQGASVADPRGNVCGDTNDPGMWNTLGCSSACKFQNFGTGTCQWRYDSAIGKYRSVCVCSGGGFFDFVGNLVNGLGQIIG